MANIITIVGSPSEPSRTAFVIGHLADRFRREGHAVTGTFRPRSSSTGASSIRRSRAHWRRSRAPMAWSWPRPSTRHPSRGCSRFSSTCSRSAPLAANPRKPSAPPEARRTCWRWTTRSDRPWRSSARRSFFPRTYVTDPAARFELSAQTSAKLDELAQRLVRCLRAP